LDEAQFFFCWHPRGEQPRGFDLFEWRLNLLGSCELRGPAGDVILINNRKGLALLAFLLLQPDRKASRERLAGLLWGDADHSQSRLNLRKCLSLLKQQAASAGRVLPLEVTPESIGVTGGGIRTDVQQLEELIEAPLAPAEQFEALARIYRGDFLNDFTLRGAPDFETWAQLERQRLRERAIAAFSAVMDRGVPGESDYRTRAALRVLALDPLQENAHRALMQIYALQGRHAAALKQYHVLADLLRQELSSDPEPETRQLFQAISRSRQRAVAPAPQRVTVANVPGEPGPDPNSRPSRRLRWMGLRSIFAVAAAAVMMVAGAIAIVPADLFVSENSDRPAQGALSVAVLPFENAASGEEGSLFAEGLTEEVIAGLSRISSLQVTGRTSSFALKENVEDSAAVGRRLGVRYLVRGVVAISGTRLRVEARLIEARSGSVLWQDRFAASSGDAFQIQQNISIAVARALGAERSGGEDATALHASPTTYRTYLLARSHLRSGDPKRIEKAVSLFRELRTADPTNPLAHTGYAEALVSLARTSLNLGYEVIRRESVRAVEQAFAADPKSVDAQLTKGFIYHYFYFNNGTDADRETAEAALRKAVEARPDARSLAMYGSHLSETNRHEQAVAYLRRAAALDPLDRPSQLELGRGLERSGRTREALRHYADLASRHPDWSAPPTAAGRLLVRYGHLESAERWLKRAVATDDTLAQAIWLVNVYVNLGMQQDAEAIMRLRMRTSPSDVVARVVRVNLKRNYGEAFRLTEMELARGDDPIWTTGAFSFATILHRHDDARLYLKRAAPDMMKPEPGINSYTVDVPLMAAHHFKETGNQAQARRILLAVLTAGLPTSRHLQPADYVWRAGAYAELGDHDRALKELRLAVRAGWRTLIDANNFIRIDDYPMFERLRDDPRFKQIINEVERANASSRMRLLERRSKAGQPDF
jgi:DNA-binding SARP family transcriptional activator/TolB-like protein